MKNKTHSNKEIFRILWQAERGEPAQANCRQHTISEQILYLWKKKAQSYLTSAASQAKKALAAGSKHLILTDK